MNTKELIINTTKELCNLEKASNITTNHIASAAGIRSGNLYYHFKNKEAIIREICYELFAKMDQVWDDIALITSEEGLVSFFYKINSILYDYRFFYVELNLLLTKDPELRKSYVDRSVSIIDNIFDSFTLFIQAGIMRDIPSNDERHSLSKNLWVIGQLWISYSDILGTSITSEIVAQGVKQCYSILRPYVKSRSNQKISRLLLRI